MPKEPGPRAGGAGAVEDQERRIIDLCEAAVGRPAAALPDAEVGVLQRHGDTLRHIAHAGRLRLIYEVHREQGGVVWRAADRREVQRVEDVRADPDYLASDERVISEIAAPIRVDGEVRLVVDIEFSGRVFTRDEAAVVESEVERLERALADQLS